MPLLLTEEKYHLGYTSCEFCFPCLIRKSEKSYWAFHRTRHVRNNRSHTKLTILIIEDRYKNFKVQNQIK
jgi:hypothetical protein